MWITRFKTYNKCKFCRQKAFFVYTNLLPQIAKSDYVRGALYRVGPIIEICTDIKFTTNSFRKNHMFSPKVITSKNLSSKEQILFRICRFQ